MSIRLHVSCKMLFSLIPTTLLIMNFPRLVRLGEDQVIIYKVKYHLHRIKTVKNIWTLFHYLHIYEYLSLFRSVQTA